MNKKNDNINYEKQQERINDISKDIFPLNLIQNNSQINSSYIYKNKNKISQLYLMSNYKNIIDLPNIKEPFNKKNSYNKKIITNLPSKKKNKNNGENIVKHFKFSIFEYLCFQKCSKNDLNIILFDEASTFYKNQMDVINIFCMVLLFTEKAKKENKNIINNISFRKKELRSPTFLDNIFLNAE